MISLARITQSIQRVLPRILRRAAPTAATFSIGPKPAKRYHLTSKEREHLTTNLALLLRAAVPIGDALNSLAESGSSKQFKQAMGQVRTDIDNGFSLSKALDRSGVISAQTLALIRLGEEAGNLNENLDTAAKQEEKQRMFQAKVRSALLYPGFVLGLTVIVGIGVSWFLLPRLSETFGQLRVELPAISRVLIGFGIFLRDNGLWAVPAFFALLIVAGIVLFRLPKTRNIGRNLLFKIPGVGRLLLEVETARFGYLLGTLLRAGLSVTQSLQLLIDATSAPRHKQLYIDLKNDFDSGYSFRQAFEHHKRRANRLISPAVQQMIIAAERSGALPETLVKVGTIYEDKTDISTKNLEVILEPILLVFVWTGVLVIAIAVILPIYSLVGGIDGGVQ